MLNTSPFTLTSTPTMATVQLTPTSDQVVGAGYGVVVPNQFTISNGVYVTIGDQGVLQISG